MTTKPKALRVLCFGDSLTQGFCDFGLTSHPYSKTLERRLAAAFPEMILDVYTNGVPGDIVSGPAFRRRLVNEFERRRYDWMIILGGTNDLGSMISVKETSQALTDIWDLALLKGSKVLALTIPECHAEIGWLNERRDAVNEYIISHKQKNFHAFDLKSKIPFHSLSDEDRRKYWDDGLHLSSSGYDWMGDHIADAFIDILNTEPPPQPSSSRRFSHRREDEKFLDEETGNPKVINQGYVVVRKKDLD
ncbi:hypothetical protein PT974_09059 [Cladobotryum mycophilum]|uniref:SGNH hydrolase-type esterase domain-containing protein n=1 Tax=Cladobotryum mycophilum TaxID=491253 RepID=A0ABR0SGH7_9HYPO